MLPPFHSRSGLEGVAFVASVASVSVLVTLCYFGAGDRLRQRDFYRDSRCRLGVRERSMSASKAQWVQAVDSQTTQLVRAGQLVNH